MPSCNMVIEIWINHVFLEISGFGIDVDRAEAVDPAKAAVEADGVPCTITRG